MTVGDVTRRAHETAYVVDEARWPLLVAIATEVAPDRVNDAIDEMYRAFESALARKERFVTLFDMRGAVSDAARRKRLAHWIDNHRSKLRSHHAAHAVIVESTFERGVVTAMLWLVPMFEHTRVFTDVQEAETWLRTKL